MTLVQRSARPVLPEPEPGDPHWFKTVEEAVLDDPNPSASTRIVQQIVMGGHRLRAASDTFSTFSKDYEDFGRLLWIDMAERPDEEINEMIAWIREQAWHGHVGVGWQDSFDDSAAVMASFVLFDDTRDQVLFKLRWT